MTTLLVRVSAGAAALGGLLAFALPASADITVVSTVTVTRQTPSSTTTQTPSSSPQNAAPFTLTQYYKDGDARTDVSGGTVTLYNSKTGQVCTLDPSRKTYYTLPLDQTADPAKVSRVKAQGSVDVDPVDGAKTLAGLPARVFILSGTVSVSPQSGGFGGRRGGGGRGGGRHHGGGGGGFPGSGGGGFPGLPLFQNGGYGGGSGGDRQGTGPSQNVEVSGEVWLSDDLKLPGDKKATLLPFVRETVSDSLFVVKPLTDSLNKKKEIPLDSRVTLTRTDPDTGQQVSEATTTRVVRVSQAPLSDALFQIPVGYTLVAPPPGPQVLHQHPETRPSETSVAPPEARVP